MNKKDLVDQISELSEMSKKDVEKVLDSLSAVIMKTLGDDGEAKLLNFGSFKVVDKEAHKARNPLTGETVDVPAKKVVKFKVSKPVKTYFNS